jgi:hypothetical protein
MGVINSNNLYPILWAADNFSTHEDPSLRINEYLVANNVFTANIRNDSGQPDAWRDYQQILSELGLIYSTEIVRQITLTPIGIAYLDKLVSYSELMTLQALRYQYPNGHKIMISPSLRKDLQGSDLAKLNNLVEVQSSTKVLIRPAVLIWQIIRILGNHGSEHTFLTFDEIRNYVMRCTDHSEMLSCVEAIMNARIEGVSLPALLGTRGRRNMQDWMKFLSKTPIFETERQILKISYSGYANCGDIDNICSILATEKTFWEPTSLNKQDRISWYSFFGSLDLELDFTNFSGIGFNTEEELEFDPPSQEGSMSEARFISLQAFNEESLRGLKVREGKSSTTIDVSYDAEIADKQHRLHDRMVVMIGSYFKNVGASVFFDPKTVDVLVQFDNLELLIEVKSVTTKNTLSKIRNAVGQICYYDYLRSKESQKQKRKMIALTAKVPDDAWYIDFLNNHLDIDLISINGQDIKIFSSSDTLNALTKPGSND